MPSRRNAFVLFCFLAMFGAALLALAPDFFAALRSYTWQRTPCVVEKSKVVEQPFSRTVMHYVASVEYRYEFGGRKFVSKRYTTGKRQGSTDVSRAVRAVEILAPGTAAICYVNPRDPAEAVLERGELWGGIFLLTPFLIWGLMFHEAIFGWIGQRRARRLALKDVPLSERNEALRFDGRWILFGVLGFVMGGFFLGFCLVAPLRAWSGAREWVRTEAVVTQCEMVRESGQHGPTYSLRLVYDYDFGGRHYRADRKSFGTGIDEPVVDLSSWAAAHPAGTRVECFVNPRKPSEAVLERELKIGWISLLLGGMMLLLGMTMTGKLLKTWWMRQLLREKLLEYCLGIPVTEKWLRVTPPPLLTGVGAALAGLLAVAAATWSLDKGVRALMHGEGDILNLLYGAGAAIAAVWLFNQSGKFLVRGWRPRPRLHLRPGTPRVGEMFEVGWEFSGPVRSLRIWLEGAEEVKVRKIVEGYHGAIAEEKTERLVFSTVPVMENLHPDQRGSVAAVVAAGSMHSFRGAKCGIAWEMKVRFASGRGEELDYSFPVTVRPAKV
jgi:hypothetical protein